MNYHCVGLLLLLLLLLYCCKTTTSSEIANATKLSIRLCCKPSEVLNTTTLQCEPLPLDFNVAAWNVTVNLERVNIVNDLNYKVEMMSCRTPYIFHYFDYSNDTEHCYTPYYHNELEKYIIATVDCALIIHIYNYIHDKYFIGVILSTIFLVLTILVYVLLKELRHTLHWKLFLCHFVSWLLSHVLAILSIWLMCIDMVLYVWIFFISSRLWLKVIGYEIWWHFGNSFRECELQELNRKRFCLYSLFVWGVSLLASLSSWYLKDSKPMDTWASFVPIVLLLIASLCGFGHITYQIGQIRKKVFNTDKGKYFLRESIPIVLCIVYMMVLPWIMLLAWLAFYRNVYVAVIFYIYLVVEGPVMFAIFVPKRKLRFLWQKRTAARNMRSLKRSPETETTYVFG